MTQRLLKSLGDLSIFFPEFRLALQVMSMPANRSYRPFPGFGSMRQHSSHPPSVLGLRLASHTRHCLMGMAPKTGPPNVQAT